MKVFATIAAIVAVASAESWTQVNWGAGRGRDCLKDGLPASSADDCDIQASDYTEALCKSVGGQCAMSLAKVEENCGAIDACAGVFCAPFYSDDKKCLARSASELAYDSTYTGGQSAGVYNVLKPVQVCPATAAANGTTPSAAQSQSGTGISVQCATGFSTNGTAECKSDNSWILPECQDDPCPATAAASGTTPYAPQSSTGGGIAVACATGYATTQTATCRVDDTWDLPACVDHTSRTCGAGEGHTNGTSTSDTSCDACANNEVSPGGQATCTACGDGQKPKSDQSDCEDCAAGFAGTNGACTQCVDGKTPNTAKDDCDDCAAGFAGTSGACAQCVDGKTPNAAKNNCDDCAAGFAGVNGTCSDCVSGTEPNANSTECVAVVLNSAAPSLGLAGTALGTLSVLWVLSSMFGPGKF